MTRVPNLDLDIFPVVEEVHRLRELWRPKRTRIVLLAESHARTTEEDFANRWHVPGTSYHGNFVKFVYCLGNGEKSLVPAVNRNVGTAQFWKILFSCLRPVRDNRDFAPILHSTPFNERIANNIDLLSRIRERGIWLIDSSIVSTNHVRDVRARKKILEYSWNHYTGPLVRSLQPAPKHMLVIGKLFPGSALSTEISSLGIDYTVLPQPQARLQSGYVSFYRIYHEKCSSVIQ